MRPFIAALALAAALAAPCRAADLRHPEDAALHAVQFIDDNEGWTVGDAGVVWHTIDAGQNWERQPTGVRASLRAIHFLNPYTGWIVGREELPNGAGSVGTVLVTRDGGLKWQRLCIHGLPGLQRVRFFDDKNGIAAGDGSEQFPSGVFNTADGGRTWKPVAGPRCPTWLAADFQDAQTGALAGTWSRLATLRNGVFGAADVDMLGGRSVRGLQLVGNRAVAVGQGGLVLVSASSGGVRWGFADLKLRPETLACMDFHAVACRGDHIWVAGRPGSVVMHSADRGATWQMQPTKVGLPLNGLHFLNERHGWAVGELGTVMNTTDGGQTWTVQRQGGQRAAILCVHARPGGAPLDVVSVLGGDDGYLTASLQMTAADPASASLQNAGEPQRLAAALRQAGGAAGEVLWHFPVPQHLGRADRREVIAAWDRQHGDRAAEQFLRQVVLAIRMWRPEVIVTDDGKTDSADNIVESLVAEAVQEAYKRAADPQAFPEQIEHLGLKSWEVKKLYARHADRNGAPVVLDLNEARARLEGTAGDVTAASLAVLGNETPVPAQTYYRLLASRIDGAASHTDLMQGVPLTAGGTARRALSPLPESSADIEKAIQTRRNLQALAATPLGGLTDPNRLLGQVAPALAQLPDDQGAPAAFAIANQFAQAGQWTLAREAFFLLVDRYPAHPLATDAYRWLIRYNSSSEARRRQELGQFFAVTRSEMLQVPNGGTPEKEGLENRHSRQLAVLGDLAEARRWYEGCLKVEPRLSSFGSVYASDPAVQFCLQSARRNLGDFKTAQDWYSQFVKDHAEGPWREAAAAELWLANRTGPPPKPLASCPLAVARPVLDGQFEDACWDGVQPLRLKNAVGDTTADYGTEARLTYDKDFLYLALRCKHPAERRVDPMTKRRRDEDLRPYDRVSLLLDLDRDFSTCFHLQVDQRGCLCEDCWGDRTWNPKWFVAVRSEATCWQIEAAIPLIELTGEPVAAGRAWACNVVRILPGRGVQAWSIPADVLPRPEGMGLLMFLQDQRKPAAEAPPVMKLPVAASAPGR